MVNRRQSELENKLEQIGRRSIANHLTIDDIGEALGAAMADQRKHLLAHMNRWFRLMQLRDGAATEQKIKKINLRLLEIEAELRRLQRDSGVR